MASRLRAAAECHGIRVVAGHSVGSVIDLANLAAVTEPDRIAAALGILIAKYPAFRFFHASIGRRGTRWIAARINSRDPGTLSLPKTSPN